MSADRKARRERERAQAKLVAGKLRLAALEPGGSASNPRDVRSASLVELTATSEPCLACGEAVRLLEHRAEMVQTQLLRVVDVACKFCNLPRRYWLRVAPVAAN